MRDGFIGFGLNRAFCACYCAFFAIATTTAPTAPAPTTLVAFALSGFFRTQSRGAANNGAFRVGELGLHGFRRVFQRQVDGFGYGLRGFALAALATFSPLATRFWTLGTHLVT